MPTFDPIDYDPFAQQPSDAATPDAGPKFTPVEHDPFAQDVAPRNDTEAANQAFLADNRGFGWSPSAANKLERATLGAAEPIAGAAQLAAHATGYGTETADATAKQLAQSAAEKKAEAGLGPEDWDLWAGAGNIASPVNFLPGAAIERVAGAGRTLMGLAGRGAAAGAAYGAMDPVNNVTPENDYWAQKQGQATTGAITGGITGPAAGLVAKAVSPAASKTAAQLTAEGADAGTIQLAEDLALMDREGVRTTIGQRAGIQRSESHVGDVPFAGSQYRERLQDFREDANRAALNRAVPPGAQPIPRGGPVGTQGVARLEQDFNTAYNNAHAQMSFSAQHPSFTQMGADLTTLQGAAAQDLAPAESARLGQIINAQIYGKIEANGGVLDGRGIQAINSKLRYLSRGFSKENDVEKQMLGAAINDARQAFSNSLMAQNTPSASAFLREVDNRYAYFVRARAATVAAKNNGGVFTGNQLLNATTQLNSSVGKGEIAAGRDPFYQDLADAMIRLTSRMPNSGSPERGAMLGLAAAAAGTATIPTHTIAGIGSLTAAYTGPGQAVLNAAVRYRPPGAPAVARALREYGPTVGTRAIMGAQQPEQRARGGAVSGRIIKALRARGLNEEQAHEAVHRGLSGEDPAKLAKAFNLAPTLAGRLIAAHRTVSPARPTARGR